MGDFFRIGATKRRKPPYIRVKAQQKGGRYSMTDEKLIQALRRGHRDALHRAIDRYSGYVAAVARNVLGEQATKEDLEEIVADVFVALWRASERLEESRPLTSYLAVIARHAAIDRLRRLRPEEPLPEDDLLTADEAQQPEIEALRRDRDGIPRGGAHPHADRGAAQRAAAA